MKNHICKACTSKVKSIHFLYVKKNNLFLDLCDWCYGYYWKKSVEKYANEYIIFNQNQYENYIILR